MKTNIQVDKSTRERLKSHKRVKKTFALESFDEELNRLLDVEDGVKNATS